MVRHYPLTMFLALFSTLQMYELSSANLLDFSNKKIYLYAVTVALGLYTQYFFGFVFIFQLMFLLLSNYKETKALLVISAITALTFLLFLPQIPTFLYQRQVKPITAATYFYGEIDLSLLANYLTNVFFKTNFWGSTFRLPGSLFYLLVAAILPIIILGCYSLWQEKLKRSYLIALAGYLLI